jgi:hypothetical protein
MIFPLIQEKLKNMIYKIDKDLSGKLIYECDDQYILFDLYRIKPESESFIVTKEYSDISIEFGNLRNAAAWCILDKYNKIIPARRIVELDKLLTSKIVDKTIHSRLQKKNSNYEIYRDKMLFDILRQKQILEEIDKYIIMAKECQKRGFKNELTRIE